MPEDRHIIITSQVAAKFGIMPDDPKFSKIVEETYMVKPKIMPRNIISEFL